MAGQLQVPEDRPSVGIAPLPGERLQGGASLESFGGGTAAGHVDLGGIDTELRDIHDTAKRNADSTAILDAAGKIAATEARLGARTRALHGQASFTAPEDNKGDYDKALGEIETGLTNDAQRAGVAQLREQHWANLDSLTQEHVAHERGQYEDDVYAAHHASETSATLQNGKPERVTQGLANLAIGLDKHLDAKGITDPDIRKAAQEKTASDLNVAYVQQLVDQDRASEAQLWFDGHKDQIAGLEQGPLRKRLEEGTARAESQVKADAIDKLPISDSAKLAKAAELPAGLLREKVEERLVQSAGRRHQAKQQDQTDAENQAGQLLSPKDGSPGVSFADLQASIKGRMSMAGLEAAKGFAHRIATGAWDVTDQHYMQTQRNNAATPAMQATFLHEDLLLARLGGKLDQRDYEELLTKQEGIRTKDANTLDAEKGFYSEQEIIRGVMKGAGMDVTYPGESRAKKSDDLDAQERVQQAMNAWAIQFGKDNKRRPSPEETTDRANALVMKHLVTEPGHLWDSHVMKRIDQMKPGETLATRVEDIPEAALQQLKKEHGWTNDAKTLVDAYNARLRGLLRGTP